MNSKVPITVDHVPLIVGKAIIAFNLGPKAIILGALEVQPRPCSPATSAESSCHALGCCAIISCAVHFFNQHSYHNANENKHSGNNSNSTANNNGNNGDNKIGNSNNDKNNNEKQKQKNGACLALCTGGGAPCAKRRQTVPKDSLLELTSLPQ